MKLALVKQGFLCEQYIFCATLTHFTQGYIISKKIFEVILK